ncbi:hypothetical protein EYF80_015027 [Liparis tanakae]|uniref:Uncharacterized protein n=1 Tax=Liparis tanakae TaxID=230148 RepID=A0A4Z2I9E7_9TELE|nr:hypothetical protein EYF80_015027 [Liparis tanakae]
MAIQGQLRAYVNPSPAGARAYMGINTEKHIAKWLRKSDPESLLAARSASLTAMTGCEGGK